MTTRSREKHVKFPRLLSVMADEGAGLGAPAAAAAPEDRADNAGRGLMPLPGPFGGDAADDAAHEVAGAGADDGAGAGAGPAGEPAAPFPVGDIAAAPDVPDDGDAGDDGEDVHVDFSKRCAEVALEFEELREGVAEGVCPWCRKPGCCCRRITDAVLIEMRACAMSNSRSERASGIAYLANALAAVKPEGAGPRADGGGVARRGAGRAVTWMRNPSW